MRQVKQRIENDYPDQFIVGTMSMQGVIMNETDEDAAFFSYIPNLLSRSFNITVPKPNSWDDWSAYFMKNSKVFHRPVILLIDEFDKLPARIIDRLVNLFRDRLWPLGGHGCKSRLLVNRCRN
jgi:hypothetical protein